MCHSSGVSMAASVDVREPGALEPLAIGRVVGAALAQGVRNAFSHARSTGSLLRMAQPRCPFPPAHVVRRGPPLETQAEDYPPDELPREPARRLRSRHAPTAPVTCLRRHSS